MLRFFLLLEKTLIDTFIQKIIKAKLIRWCNSKDNNRNKNYNCLSVSLPPLCWWFRMWKFERSPCWWLDDKKFPRIDQTLYRISFLFVLQNRLRFFKSNIAKVPNLGHVGPRRYASIWFGFANMILHTVIKWVFGRNKCFGVWQNWGGAKRSHAKRSLWEMVEK